VFPRAILSRLRLPFRHPGNGGSIALMNELVHPARHLGPWMLGAGIDDSVLAIDEDDFGRVCPRLFVRHLAKRGDDRDVTRPHVMRSGTVNADHTRTARTLQGIRCEPCASRHVPDLDLLML